MALYLTSAGFGLTALLVVVELIILALEQGFDSLAAAVLALQH